MSSVFPAVSIGESSIHVSDGNYSSKYPKSHEFLSTGVPFVSANNLRDGRIAWDNMKFISADLHATLKKGHVRAGDVLLVTRGSLGLTALVTREFEDANINAQIVLLRADNETLDSLFLYFVAKSPEFQDQITSNATGTAQPQLPIGPLKRMTVPIPPLPVQRRIAGILWTYDELIDNSQRRIRSLETMARSLYREWFVEFRFPGHEKVRRVASALGKIPEGWEVKKLGEVAQVNRAQLRGDNVPERIRYIDIASVSPGRIDTVTSYGFHDAPGRARRIVEHGDVIWSCVRPNRRSYALIIHPQANTIASTGFAVLTAARIPFVFLYFVTTTDHFVAYLTNNATGSAYPAVTAATFEKAKLIIPPAPLLAQFEQVTLPMSEETEILNRQITNLSLTRDLLLPRLLAGDIKLKAN